MYPEKQMEKRADKVSILTFISYFGIKNHKIIKTDKLNNCYIFFNQIWSVW